MFLPAYICDAIRTPFCRQDGMLASMRPSELAAAPLTALTVRNAGVDWEQLSDVVYGCAHPLIGEPNPARLAVLLAELPESVSASTVNRLCGSGMDAIGIAARAIKSGEAELAIAGGVEVMSHHADIAILDPALTTEAHSFAAMAQTAGQLGTELGIDREAQDAWAWSAYQKAHHALQSGVLEQEIAPVTLPHTRREPYIATQDELKDVGSVHGLANARTLSDGGAITSENAAHPADGACALLLASEKAAHRHQLTPRARILGLASVGVPPPLSGIAAACAVRKLLVQVGIAMEEVDLFELDEYFAAQSIAVLRDCGLRDDDARINPNGGSLALGHPRAATGARLVTTASYQLQRTKSRYALCAMSIAMGQGIAMLIERV